MLACLIHSLVFFFFAKLKIDLILEKVKPKLYLLVLVIYANVCKVYLVKYAYFFLSIVKYYEYIKDLLRSKIYQYIIKKSLIN